MTDISDEVVERMVAFTRQLAGEAEPTVFRAEAAHGIRDEARAIVALLPEPLDPDLQIVRQLFAEYAEQSPPCTRAAYIGRGEGDQWFETSIALLALKRGRELALSDTAELLGALDRIAKLNPRAANAETPDDLYFTVRAIAETAIAKASDTAESVS